MKKTAYELFKTMYIILNELWKENQKEDLRIYVSDANPLFHEDGRSLDPVVFEDFEAMYKQKAQENMNEYDFIVYYLENLDPYYGNIKQYFLNVSREEFESKL